MKKILILVFTLTTQFAFAADKTVLSCKGQFHLFVSYNGNSGGVEETISIQAVDGNHDYNYRTNLKKGEFKKQLDSGSIQLVFKSSSGVISQNGLMTFDAVLLSLSGQDSTGYIAIDSNVAKVQECKKATAINDILTHQ